MLWHSRSASVGKVEIGPNVTAPAAGTQRLQHCGLDLRRLAGSQFDEFGIAAGALEERHLQGGPMLDRAPSDRTSKRGDLFGCRAGVRLVEELQSAFADAIQVSMVEPDQLDKDGFLRFEVVIEAARENACRIGDLLQ